MSDHFKKPYKSRLGKTLFALQHKLKQDTYFFNAIDDDLILLARPGSSTTSTCINNHELLFLTMRHTSSAQINAFAALYFEVLVKSNIL